MIETTPGSFVVETRDYRHPDVVRMVAEVQAEYVQRYGGPDEAAVDPAEFDPPDGLFVVGLLGGIPVATGGWRRMGRTAAVDTAEIKRMYVSITARRRGLGARVLAELEHTARAAGIARLVLNTGTEQPEAIAMYQEAGYGPQAPFGHYAGHEGALFYGKDLRDLGEPRDLTDPEDLA